MDTNDILKPSGKFQLECYSADGDLIWEEKNLNTVLTVGKNLALDILFGSTSAISTWHIGVSTDTTTVTAGYTLTGEVGTRQSTTFTRSGSTSTSTQVSLTGITATIALAFLATASTGGTIFAASTLSTPRTVVSTDTLRLTYSVTMT